MAVIALLGTGHMGTAIAHRLMATGHQVVVWNRTASRTTGLVDAGARLAATPAQAATGADVVITMLTDASAVEAVLFGPGGAAPALRPGVCLVDMSTIGPDAVRELASRLPDGVKLVDAPVAGSVGAATAGTLTILAGGPNHAVDQVTPVLEHLGTVRRCGGSGTAAATKLVLNTALVTAFASLADTLTVADAVGADRELALELLAAGPLGATVQRATASGSAFAISLAHKDIRLALGHLDRASVPVAHAAAQTLASATNQAAELSTIVSLTEKP